MKFLVSFMFQVNEHSINYGYQELYTDVWSTEEVVKTVAIAAGVEPSTVIITNVFQIPEQELHNDN